MWIICHVAVGGPLVFITPHADIVTTTMPPCCKCAHQATNKQLVVFHFSSDVLDSVGLVSMGEPHKIIKKLRRPAPKVFSGAWSLTVVALPEHRFLPRLRTRNTAGHEQHKDIQRHVSVVEGNRKSNQSVTGHAFHL